MIILENNDYHRYYDFICEYSAYNIFDMVMNGVDLWTPLIQPQMYHKALLEFTKLGYLAHFPSKYVYQWMGIIMKNTAILRTTTEIAGHSEYFPSEDFFDYFFNDDGVDKNGLTWDRWKSMHNFDDDDEYEAITEYLDEVGFYDNLVLPDGSDAWSDFGIEPIEKLILTYNENLSPEEVLVIINKILDVTHMRGDLSSMFIEGGKSSLNKITYNESKTIKLTEQQVTQLLKENLSDKVYHFTSIINALHIAEEDAIFLQSALEGYANTSSQSKLFYLSTTRTKYQSFGYSRKFSDNAARIEFDGEKLNNDFSAIPYNYWGDSMGKPTYLKNDGKGLNRDKQEHVRDEAEDRLLSHQGIIEPAHKYIKRIDIILSDNNEKNRINYLNVYNLLRSKYRNIVFVYDNLDDFNKQNSNTINDKFSYSSEINGTGLYDTSRYNLNSDVIKLVLAAILNGESDNPSKDSANLLKKYGLERYLHRSVLQKNDYMYYPYNIQFSQLADLLSNKLSDISKRPSREKQKILQMLTDYFRSNKLKNYQDYVKHKNFSIELPKDYMLIQQYINKGYVDSNKKINVLLIRNLDTYDNVIVYNVNQVKVSDFNTDLESVGEFFVNYTAEKMKSSDYYSYKKYIMRIFKKDPTIGYIIQLLKQLGYENNILEMLQNILDTKIEKQTIDIYSLNYDMVMPQCIHNKKYNITKFISLFKK